MYVDSRGRVQYFIHSWVHCITDSRSSINTFFSRIPEEYGSWNDSFHPFPKLRSWGWFYINSVHREGERDEVFKKLFLLIFQTIEDN